MKVSETFLDSTFLGNSWLGSRPSKAGRTATARAHDVCQTKGRILKSYEAPTTLLQDLTPCGSRSFP